MNPACWMTAEHARDRSHCPNHAATLDAAVGGQPPLQPPPRAERATARSLTGNQHAPHADGRAAADSSESACPLIAGAASVDPLTPIRFCSTGARDVILTFDGS